MAKAARTSRAGLRRGSPRPKPGVKRNQILDIATDYFGRYGYEETKWADVAAAVGIGSTALYHYFESKQHCLYEIMTRAVAERQECFDRIVEEHSDWTATLVELLVDGFDLTERDVLRHRVLLAQHARVAGRRDLPREEAARESARTQKRDLELAWAAFLERGMQQGLLPRKDPHLTARALLGLYNSIWSWYRPGRALSVADVGRFYVSRQLALLGGDPGLAADRFPAAT